MEIRFCAREYLKTKGFLYSEFGEESTHSVVPVSNCTEVVESLKNGFHKDYDRKTGILMAAFWGRIPQRLSCFMEEVKKLEDLAIEIFVFYYFNLTSMKFSSHLNELKSAYKKKINEIKMVCVLPYSFSELFGKICEKPEKSPIDDYCIRKYLTENNVINNTIHQIDLNPQKGDVTGADCDEAIKRAKEEATSELKEQIKVFAVIEPISEQAHLDKSFIENRYFETVSEAAVFCKVKATPEIREYERGKFVKDMESWFESVSKYLFY